MEYQNRPFWELAMLRIRQSTEKDASQQIGESTNLT